VPSILLSNGQSVFISSLLETTQSCLQQLNTIKYKLDMCYGYDQRVEFLTSVTNQRNEALEQLQDVKPVYSSLNSDELVKEHVAYELFGRIFKQVNLALNWGNKIERNVMNEITQQTGVWDRIKAYQTETEAKITLLLQVSEPEYSKIQEQLKQISQKIENEIQVVTKSQDYEAKESLESLLIYIRSTAKSNTTEDTYQGRIKRCETELFSLVDSINRLTLDNTEGEFLSLKKSLTLLTKEISSLRNSLEKKISSGDSVVENKARVDHLEDMQENLSDLVYTHANKFEAYSRSLSEKTLSGSKKKNTRQMDGLYEL